MSKHKNKLLIIGIMLLCLFVLDWHCPIQSVFGIPCPGCNMTTALYHLLKGNLSLSIWYHAMLIPTGICAAALFLFPKKQTRIIWIWVILMLIYYIYRMVYVFPDAPMIYDESCLLQLTFHLLGL